MRLNNKYRFRSASGREHVIEVADPNIEYFDRETGEPLHPVAKLVPVAPTPSELPWAVENLRFCNHCDQMCQVDLTICPVCGEKLDPLPAASE